jgi:DNA repair exonuclease SbcCD ATPase subunit
MILLNFKGIISYSLAFGNETNILGDNATGKTTLFDAFTWCLFGKDSLGRETFEIKTLEGGKVKQKIDHSVEALIEVDGIEIKLKRLLREKWVKKRGEPEPEMVGHETFYYINDVPKLQSEFKTWIGQLVNEELFKIITSTSYFNQLITWQSRRNLLFKIAGDISNSELAEGNQEFENLLKEISGKSLIDFKKEISMRKKKLKDDLEQIPTRIDEVTRSIPESVNVDELNNMINILSEELHVIDEGIQDKSKAYSNEVSENRKRYEEINRLNGELNKILNDKRDSHDKLNREYHNSISSINNKIEFNTKEIEKIKSGIEANRDTVDKDSIKLEKFKKDWNEINAKNIEFKENQFDCPTCKRPLDNIEEIKSDLIANFNRDKSEKLSEINKTGKALSEKILEMNKEIENLTNSIHPIEIIIEDLKKELTTIVPVKESNIEESDQEKSIKRRITEIQGQITEIPEVDNKTLTDRKTVINSELDNFKKKLNTNENIEKGEKRIQEINEEGKNLSQQIANLEKREFIIDKFNRARIDFTERKISGLFKYVKWKLFDIQINGAEVECCECMVDGVPFSNLNTASQINAGIDCINTISEHFDVFAPVWIDHAESINHFIETKTQIIKLIVSEDKSLKKFDK